MGKSNKGARQSLIRKFGRICMIEAAGIRKIPVSERKKIKGYKKYQEQITYHHLTPVRDGGKTTEENGALIKNYNHQWLETLPDSEREEINDKLRQFKLNFSTMSITEKGEFVVEAGGTLDFGQTLNEEDCIIIPVYDTKKKPKGKDKIPPKTRAQLKRELQDEINEALEQSNDDYCL